MSFFDCVRDGLENGMVDKGRGERAQAMWRSISDQYERQGHDRHVAEAMAGEDVKEAFRKEAGKARHVLLSKLVNNRKQAVEVAGTTNRTDIRQDPTRAMERVDYRSRALKRRFDGSLQDYLDQGFTTARDAGCNILGIAKAVNNDIIPGPRLYPSGAFLSQTGGHADTGSFNDIPGDIDDLEAHMFGFIADGVPEVIRAARHNLRAGATQIKVMAGGGVASEFDPLHTTQYSLEELKAIVGVAEDYGTYSFMKEGGCSLAPYGTFEGKIPQEALDLVAAREAAIKSGEYSVEINDEEPKSS